MPGERDPSNFTLPQQPLNKCLVPRASKLPTLATVPNPHRFQIGDVQYVLPPLLICSHDDFSFLGNSGQPIDNVVRYVDTPSRMDVVKSTIEWRNVCPLAPDTLGSFPGYGLPSFLKAQNLIRVLGKQILSL